jgi:hypothetical protein
MSVASWLHTVPFVTLFLSKAFVAFAVVARITAFPILGILLASR